jgi:tripeptide aminopeptidase
VSNARLLETFLDLVRIDSPSREEAAVAQYCRGALEDMGFEVSFDDSTAQTASDTGNLIAFHPGRESSHTLVLSAHMDCVEPCRGVEPLVEEGVIRSAGDTVLGGDDKVGIAAILESARRLLGADGPVPALRVVLTVSEETGLTGAKALEAGSADGDLCLVLDAAGAPGGIVVAAPTHYTFRAIFKGKAAHAGVEPEKGVSAVAMAARAVAAMELGRLDDETTANVGTFEGGSATNVVAPEAELTGECRSLDSERVDEVRRSMHAVMREAAAGAGGEVDIEWTEEYRGFRFEEDDPLLEIVEAAARDVGVEPHRFETGGGSDGNVLTLLGVPTLVLASGMSEVHGISESVRVRDLETLTEIVCAVAPRLAAF